MSDISAEDLQPGDWLLFEGDPGSWMSKAIMMLTDSEVSHAALYIGDGKVAEEISPGLVVTPIQDRLDRKTWVMRRKTPHPDLAPVLATADEYLEEGEKYAFGTLVMLGLVLIYKKVAADSLVRRAAIAVLKAATLGVAKLLEKFKYDGKTPMVCSQFVYECYAKPSAQDGAYRLVLVDPALAGLAMEEKSLIDEMSDYPEPPPAEEAAGLAAVEEVLDPEEAAKQLVEALQAAQQSSAALDTGLESLLDDELYLAAREFTEVAAPLIEGGEPDEGALAMMADYKSYFVAPSDLLNVENGEQVGVIPPKASA